jgi:hypothetical protein
MPYATEYSTMESAVHHLAVLQFLWSALRNRGRVNRKRSFGIPPYCKQIKQQNHDGAPITYYT